MKYENDVDFFASPFDKVAAPIESFGMNTEILRDRLNELVQQGRGPLQVEVHAGELGAFKIRNAKAVWDPVSGRSCVLLDIRLINEESE